MDLIFCTDLFIILKFRINFLRFCSIWQSLLANCNSLAPSFIFERILSQTLSNWVRCIVVATSMVNIMEQLIEDQFEVLISSWKFNFLSFRWKIESFGTILNKLRQFKVLPPHSDLIQVWSEQKLILAHISHDFFNFVDIDLIFALICFLF